MRYFLDDKEITPEELARATDNLDLGSEECTKSEIIELKEIKNGAMYFSKEVISWYQRAMKKRLTDKNVCEICELANGSRCTNPEECIRYRLYELENVLESGSVK